MKKIKLTDLQVGMQIIINGDVDTILRLHPENDVPETSGNEDWGYTIETREYGMNSHGLVDRIDAIWRPKVLAN